MLQKISFCCTSISCFVVLFDLLNAMENLNGSDIMHNDIKMTNALVSDSGKILLTDFGSSRKANKGLSINNDYSGRGTPSYLSYRILCKPMPDFRFQDLFSLNKLAYFVMQMSQNEGEDFYRLYNDKNVKHLI